MHVGGVAIFEVPELGFDYEKLVTLISTRIGLVPRYRQRVRWVPGHLANPIWVDDENFDITFHVRRSALPRPGNHDQLADLVGRIMSRPLDRNRPLWEMYLVEGLADHKFAVLSKTHHAMVDGLSAIDIGQVILDLNPIPREVISDPWRPRREPSRLDLVASAVADSVRRPQLLWESASAAASDARATVSRLAGAVVGVASMARTMARTAPPSPLNTLIGEQRRYGMVDTKLDDYKRVRKVHGGTVNDAVLAVVSGALRSWLMTRGEAVTGRSIIRAMVPVSVRQAGHSEGNRVSSYLVDLPVGEPDPVIRLHRISYLMAGHKESGQAVAAEVLVGISGFAPPTLHSLGARTGSQLSRRFFNVVVSNVPGPQFPLYAEGARMLAAYPVVPLAKGQALSIGVTSYDGGVFYGLNADRDAMYDVDVLAACINEAMDELISTVR